MRKRIGGGSENRENELQKGVIFIIQNNSINFFKVNVVRGKF